MNHGRFVSLVSACFLFALPIRLGASAIYQITDLGVLPGGSVSSATAISSNGLVAGYGDATSLISQPFLWSSGAGLSGLNVGSPLAEALGVNASGTVAGYLLSSDLSTTSAFTTNGASTALIPTLGGANNVATAINDSGTVVGYSDTADGSQIAFSYDGSTLSSLGLLPSGTTSAAYAINASGVIAGQADAADGSFHAVVSSGGTWTDLGIPTGYASSDATAIANSGYVAGTLTDGLGASMGFLWTPSDPTDMTLLGALTVGGDSQAYGVNSSGLVVGTSDGVAFLFDSTGIQDLNTLLDPASTGWELESATAINDLGQIAGTGYYGGAMHGFLLDPETSPVPEPAGATLASVGLLLAACWRRRSRKERV
jgi:probable HAF family extracellular repeat protein